MDGFELVGRQDLCRAEAQARLTPRRLLRGGVASMAFTTATPTTSEPFTRGRIHVRHVDLPSAWARGPAPESMLLVLAPQPTDVADEGQQEVDEHHQQSEVDPRVVHPGGQEPPRVVGVGKD